MDAECVVLRERVREEVALGHLDTVGETDPDREEDTVALREDRLSTPTCAHQHKRKKRYIVKNDPITPPVEPVRCRL